MTADEAAPDGVAELRAHVLDEVVEFVRSLRAAGLTVPANAGIDATRALAEVGFDDEARARAALRATLVSEQADLPVFDRLFEEFWRRLRSQPRESVARQEALGEVDGELATPGNEDEDEDENADPGDPRDGESPAPDVEPGVTERRSRRAGESESADVDDEAESAATYSPTGRSELVESPAALAAFDGDVTAAVRRLERSLANLRGRRWERGGSTRVAVRRALRGSFATGGALVDLPRKRRAETAVRATILVDISRSVLDTIDRQFLVQFLRTTHERWRDVRIVFFDTDVQDVTDAFDAPTVAEAYEALEAVEVSWGGGTRIGHALETVRRGAVDALDRRRVVLVVSDGLEMGELDTLEREMSHYARQSGLLLWLNPLAASPEYEPTCSGIATALPFVDGLFAFAEPSDVTEIARQLRLHGSLDRIGYEYDRRRRA